MSYQHHRITFASSTRCTTCSVNEQLVGGRTVIVYDCVNNGDIQTTCCDIGNDQHRNLILLEKREVINTT